MKINTLESENLNIRRKWTLPLINPDKHLFVCEDQKLISLAFSFQSRGIFFEIEIHFFDQSAFPRLMPVGTVIGVGGNTKREGVDPVLKEI